MLTRAHRFRYFTVFKDRCRLPFPSLIPAPPPLAVARTMRAVRGGGWTSGDRESGGMVCCGRRRRVVAQGWELERYAALQCLLGGQRRNCWPATQMGGPFFWQC